MKLDGIRVLDLSAFLPGPHMTMMLADHGADVIMVEPANGVGEPTRVVGYRDAEDVSVWFRNIARGKRSLKINLKDEGGLELFLALVDTADVLVEAFRPGVVTRLGLDYATLAARATPASSTAPYRRSARTGRCGTSRPTISPCRRWPASRR